MTNINDQHFMNKNYVWIGVLAGILILGAGLYLNKNRQVELFSEQAEKNTQQETESESDLKGGAMLEKINDKTMSPDTQSSNNELWAGFGSYQTYSAELAKTELQNGRKVVLFFHAPWCPFCRAANEAFTNNTDKIPQGVTVLKTDYDSNSDLRKQYGVTYQHTFVKIDAEGNMISKWTGGDIDNLIKNLK